jgi:AcrR family transcriptional regulator
MVHDPSVHDPPTLSLRELKKRRTRLELSAAARGLVLRYGLDAITVDDIAKAAGVSPRTFFNYYETKMDAVVGPLDVPGTPEARAKFVAGGPTGVLSADLVELLVAHEEPITELREHISQIAAIVRTDPRVLAAFVASGCRHEAAIAQLLGQRLGDAATPRFVALAAALMTALTGRAALAWAEDSTGSLATAIREHCAMAAHLFQPANQGEDEQP